MNTDNTAADYARRCIRDLGLQANDTERAIIWCYDNPPKRSLPKPAGTRERNIFVSRRVFQCLIAAASENSVGGLAESILLLWIKDNMPEVQAMYDRHEQEVEARLAEVRRNEPAMMPKLEPITTKLATLEKEEA